MNSGFNTNDLITPKDLCKILAISESSTYRLINKRIIPFYKISGSLRFKMSDIDDYLESVRIKPII